ncbi:MAG: hypothetical protein HQK51_03865 [Oligoflexia bacterium]|nr:hypothetical protein [Oligoflexia bacterium]
MDFRKNKLNISNLQKKLKSIYILEKNITYIITLFIFEALISLGPKAAHTNEIERFISYDNEYNVNLNNNRSIGNFEVEFIQLESGIFDLVSKKTLVGKNPFTRSILNFVSLYPLWITTKALSISYHEFGHGTRSKALGYEVDYHFFNDGKSYDNYWDYFVASFSQNTNGGYSRAYGTAKFNSPFNAIDTSIITYAGGLNNEMFLAETIENTIYNYNGHSLMFVNYVTGKLSTEGYIRNEKSIPSDFKGDPTVLSEKYHEKGIYINRSDLGNASIISLLASSTTYSLLYGNIKYLSTGNSVVKTFKLGPLRIPDTSFYINPNGISFKISSGYSYGSSGSKFPLAIEFISKGKSVIEPTFGIRHEFLNHAVQLSCTGINGLSIEGRFEFRLGKNINITAGFNHYDIRNMLGTRMIKSFDSNADSSDIWGRLSILY